MIRGVNKVVVPVDDQAAAKEFWAERLGFDVVTDEAFGGRQWLEVTPPDRSILLILSPRSPDEPRPAVRDELPHSNVFFVCDDIERTHRELTARGVRFHTPPVKMPFGWWAMFEDADGTRYALTQEP